MHFINADRRINGIGASAEGRFFHFIRQTTHDRCGGRAQFRTESIRVGFFTYITVGIADFKFVEGIKFDCRNKDVPNTVVAVETHYMAAAVPVIKFADNGNALRIGRPDGKAYTLHAIQLGKMRA